MRALPKRRVAFGLIASATVTGCLAVTVPAYGQAAGVGNTGQASASTGGNSSAGNSSSNASGVTSAQTAPPTTSVPLLGSVLGLVLNLNSASGNASDGTSTVQTGPAQAVGSTSNNSVDQTRAGDGTQGLVYSPYGAAAPAQGATVGNSGSGSASTGGNSGVGNNSSNTALNSQTVNGGLIAIGLSLGQTASNVSNGTSAINTGPASATGNQATNAVDQTRLGGAGGFGPYAYGPGSYGIGGGAVCDGAFRFGPAQSAGVSNADSANASTGQNASVGNQSQNVARNESTVNGGLISLNVPGLLNNSASNVSNGTSGISTGSASAVGNQATNAVTQDCINPVPHARPVNYVSPPVITPGRRPGDPAAYVQPAQLARTGRDPFIMGLVAFALLFGGLMFLVWEKVEAYPKRSKLAA